ncbi:MAG: SUMF1/EgtB/PvdO family nonheme iron enzyme, partial [Deltaproteobacteria bacterium]|nr:SUMF1/EgtB/PvdO family nonheme iron enzyme [Deltaproteobacteria bacterium]
MSDFLRRKTLRGRLLLFSAALSILVFIAVGSPLTQTEQIKKLYIAEATGSFKNPDMGDILASAIRSSLFSSLKIEVFTYKNLSDHLKVEQVKEVLRCEKDTICIDEVITNFGISTRLFTDIKRPKEGVYFIDMSLSDKGKIIKTASRSYSCGDELCIIEKAQSLALELFGKKGDGGREIEERAIGEKPAGGFEISGAEEVVVSFESSPSGALLMVDGKPVCQQTPCSKLLATGNYTVSMRKERYLEKSDDVTVKKGMGPVNFTLAPDFGWLTVKSNPPGLDVKINGKIEGKTPIIRKEMSKGGYEVMVSDPGYYDQGKQVMIERGEEKVVDVTLIAKEGGLKVKAFDKDGNALSGEIFINGQKAGEIPYAGKVKVGSHEVEGRTKKGSFKKIASVKENEITEVSEVVKGGVSFTTGGVEMVYIQGGCYMMGCVAGDSKCGSNERPSHKVCVDDFYLSKTEVTVGQFEECVNDGGCSKSNYWTKSDNSYCNWGYSDRKNHPMNCVSWHGAKKYVSWLSKKTDQNYRLPTEAEWEYAAKNQGKDVIYPWGNFGATCNYAVMHDG